MVEKKKCLSSRLYICFCEKKKPNRKQNDVITVCVPRHITCTKFSDLGL